MWWVPPSEEGDGALYAGNHVPLSPFEDAAEMIDPALPRRRAGDIASLCGGVEFDVGIEIDVARAGHDRRGAGEKGDGIEVVVALNPRKLRLSGGAHRPGKGDERHRSCP